MGKLELETGETRAALTTYEHLLNGQPEHLEGLANYGRAKMKLNDFEGAERAFAKVVDLDPGVSRGGFFSSRRQRKPKTRKQRSMQPRGSLF